MVIRDVVILTDFKDLDFETKDICQHVSAFQRKTNFTKAVPRVQLFY
nr:hypothetical protein BAR15_180016 [Bartonella sp. AR 15-3]CBI79810.1 hypothetical protein BAR15_180038 [Bartonella sp. AR 15-3]